ncbi:MAG: VOC family protein [bacterium]|jgi:catechol 2,3-dioxygenase-like lactoylglutathione lyase family enzyme|nr:VOC family protein [bacterium]
MRIDRTMYVMPAFATVAVTDLVASTRWYVQGLGFEILAELPGPQGGTALVHLRRRRYQDLLLVPTAGERPGLGLSFAAGNEDLTARSDSLARVPGGSHQDPRTTPWNTLDLIAHDPDSNRITLTQIAGESSPGPLAQTDDVRRALER